MRENHTVQRSIFEHYAEHEIGLELKSMSAWLDQNMDLLDWVAADINPCTVEDTGRKGLSVESVLRCAILKQYRQLSYEDLVFCLMDSASCQTFARLSMRWFPRKSVLQRCISAITDVTWERINQRLLHHATKVENGRMLRIDSTVTATPIHEPSDSSLLWDSVRVLVRLLRQAEELAGGIKYCNHQRVAKKRMRAIVYTRGQDKKARLYRDLIEVTRKSLGYAEAASLRLEVLGDSLACEAWQAQWQHYRLLILRTIDQTERRVFAKEKVPANEKVISLFEEHSDIIVKGARDVQYGHKINLSTGRSGLVLDVVIEEGNPADSERFMPMLKRHIENYGRAPRQMAADGGYASIENLREAQKLQVKDVAFHKKRGLRVEDNGQESLGLSEVAQLQSRHRGRYLLPETCLWSWPLYLEGTDSLQGLCLVIGGRAQPGFV